MTGQRAFGSITVMAILATSIFVVGIVPALNAPADAQQFGASNAVASRLPSYASLVARGSVFADSIVKTALYESLSHGRAFHIDPSSSFGLYSAPVAKDDYEIVTFFSPNRESYITADVSNATGAILSMTFTNLGSTKVVYSSSPNWSGYSAQDCESELLGICTEHYSVAEAYGTAQAQATGALVAPESEDECCAIAEWTGVGTSDSGAGLEQGGYSWAGFQLSSLPDANPSTGYTFWTENVYAGQPPVYVSPPAGFDGVSGQVISLTTEEYALCNTSPIQWYWEEIWQLGSAELTQTIGCGPSGISWGYYMLESPSLTQCSSGWKGECQLPDFSYPLPQTITFTGNICYNTSGACIPINSNSNPGLVGWYIVHDTQDTTTGGIPSNGNSWTEAWDYPGT